MSEFGHSYAAFKTASGYVTRIDSWGTGPFIISVGVKSWRFEDSDRFGPSLICRNGELRKDPYPNENSQFWHIHNLWVKQGRRTMSNGIDCIYDFEPEENWPCACVQRDAEGHMTHIKMHAPKVKKCKECGTEKGCTAR